MSKPKAPTPPDPYKTADAQTGSSLMTSLMNNQMGMVDQVGPNGSLRYTKLDEQSFTDPTTGRTYSVPRYQATTELSPNGQLIQGANDRSAINLANLGADQSARLGDLLSRPVDMAGIPAMADRSGAAPAQYGGDLGAPQYQDFGGDAGLQTSYDVGDTKRYEDALMERMNPQLDRSRQQLETNLANRGIKLGSAAYDRALDESNRSQNDARLAAILNAGQEQSRLAGIARDQATFGNNARQQTFQNTASTTAANNSNRSQGFADQQAIQGRSDANANNRFSQVAQLLDSQDRQRSQAMNEQFAVRNQPLNELLSILGGTQVQTPNFALAAPDRMAATDYTSLMQNDFNNRQQNYATKMQGLSDMYSGLFGLGATALGPGGLFGAKTKT